MEKTALVNRESNQVAVHSMTPRVEVRYGNITEAQAQVCKRELRQEQNKKTREGEVLHIF